jgi:DNA-directed RNA polymerase specialized sigma subunit
MSEREIDQLLVETRQGGDKHAFESLVAKYQRKVARLLSRFIRDQAEIEDVAQEAFIKAYRALPRFAVTVRSTPGCTGLPSIRPRTISLPGTPRADFDRI